MIRHQFKIFVHRQLNDFLSPDNETVLFGTGEIFLLRMAKYIGVISVDW